MDQINQPKKKERKIDEAKAKETLWYMGELSWKLKGWQKKMYAAIKNNPDKIQTILASRQIGKSFGLLVYCVELCVKQPNTIIKYVAPKQKQVRTILRARIKEIIKDCPEDIKPKVLTQENMWVFPNGSEIQMAGTDNQNYDSIRGGAAHLCIVDEAGFCEDLEEVVYSVLLPTTDTTKGKIILSSTPNPKDPNHPFHDLFILPAEANDRLVKFTIHDSPFLSEQEIAEKADQYPGGFSNPRYRCEYLCEIPEEAESAALPEFRANRDRIVTDNFQIPTFYDGYVSMDVGVRDLTAALIAIYDFRNNQVLILDEFVINGENMTTKLIAEGLTTKEKEHFVDFYGEFKEPTFRVSDNDLKLINDLNFLHGFNFRATEKKDRESAYNRARMFLSELRVKIHPRCRHLIYHLENARWNKKRTDLLRLKDDKTKGLKGGHADMCFLPDSKIITDSGIKNIQDIQPFKDKVLTHKGNFKVVTNVMKKTHSGKIKKIDAVGIEPIYCTPEHRFYTAEYKKINKGKKGQTGQKFLQCEQWLPAENIDIKKDHLIIPKIDEIRNNDISLEECFIYGYWAAEGHCSQNGSSVLFAGHKKEKRVKTILQEYLNQKINHKQSKTWKKRGRKNIWRKVFEINSPHNNSRSFGISYKPLWETLSTLGKSDYKKLPEICYYLNDEQIFRLLCGYFFGDGHFSKQGLIVSTISETLAYQVLLLCNKIGLKANLNKNKGRKSKFNKEYNNKSFYTIKLDRESTEAFLLKVSITEEINKVYEEKLTYKQVYKAESKVSKNHRRIHQIEDLYYDGNVYNLEVDEDESYTVSGVSVHNCSAFVYLIRNIRENLNPYPIETHIPFNVFSKEGLSKKNVSQEAQNIFEALRGKRRK
jgi:intein/homing endonuclease